MASDDRLEDNETTELLRRLTEQTSTLIRQEMELARAEMADAAAGERAPRRSGGPAALFGLCAAGSFAAAVILALATVIEPWVAALVVALALALLSMLAASTGRAPERRPPAGPAPPRERDWGPVEVEQPEPDYEFPPEEPEPGYEPPPRYPTDSEEGVIRVWGGERANG